MMDENDTTTDTNTDELELSTVGQVGKMTFSSLAAFAASKVADKLYDSAVRWNRARKS
jgi:hypothetical protein